MAQEKLKTLGYNHLRSTFFFFSFVFRVQFEEVSSYLSKSYIMDLDSDQNNHLKKKKFNINSIGLFTDEFESHKYYNFHM